MGSLLHRLGHVHSILQPWTVFSLHDCVRRSGSVYILGQWGQRGSRRLHESLGSLLRKDISGTSAQLSNSGLDRAPLLHPPLCHPPKASWQKHGSFWNSEFACGFCLHSLTLRL